MTIWRMRTVWRITKATNTHSQYVILIAFPLQQCLAKVSHYYICTYTACIVTYRIYIYHSAHSFCILIVQTRVCVCVRARAHPRKVSKGHLHLAHLQTIKYYFFFSNADSPNSPFSINLNPTFDKANCTSKLKFRFFLYVAERHTQ